MKKINLNHIIEGFLAISTFGTTIVLSHPILTHAAVFSNTGTAPTPVISNTPPSSATPVTIFGGTLNGGASSVVSG